jgi:hypothetical protein
MAWHFALPHMTGSYMHGGMSSRALSGVYKHPIGTAHSMKILLKFHKSRVSPTKITFA